jgi:hypothetical protein
MTIGMGGISARWSASVSTNISFFLWNVVQPSSKGTLFAKRFEEAALMNAKHTDLFDKFSTTFPLKVIEKWEKMVENWESNPGAPNPYNEPEKSTYHIPNSCII